MAQIILTDGGMGQELLRRSGELFRWIARKLDRPDLNELEELPEDVRLTFAPRDAVRLDCQDGRIKVKMKLSGHRAKNRAFKIAFDFDRLMKVHKPKTVIDLDGTSTLAARPWVPLAAPGAAQSLDRLRQAARLPRLPGAQRRRIGNVSWRFGSDRSDRRRTGSGGGW